MEPPFRRPYRSSLFLLLLAFSTGACIGTKSQSNLGFCGYQPRESLTLPTPCVYVWRMVPLSDIDRLPHPEPSFEALADRITYPELAHKAGVEGTVVAHFMVDEDGTVSHVEIVRGIGAGADEEVARMLESTRFAPARRQRQPTSVRMETVVEFRFESCMERTWRRPTPLARQKASGP